jgi:carbamoyl-phosphate synthase large subunit
MEALREYAWDVTSLQEHDARLAAAVARAGSGA